MCVRDFYLISSVKQEKRNLNRISNRGEEKKVDSIETSVQLYLVIKLSEDDLQFSLRSINTHEEGKNAAMLPFLLRK